MNKYNPLQNGTTIIYKNAGVTLRSLSFHFLMLLWWKQYQTNWQITLKQRNCHAVNLQYSTPLKVLGPWGSCSLCLVVSIRLVSKSRTGELILYIRFLLIMIIITALTVEYNMVHVTLKKTDMWYCACCCMYNYNVTVIQTWILKSYTLL